MYKATISVEDPKGTIKKCFAPEDKEIKGKASYKLTGERNIVFEIAAQDSTGLRTVLNSITKMLTVVEKMKNVR